MLIRLPWPTRHGLLGAAAGLGLGLLGAWAGPVALPAHAQAAGNPGARTVATGRTAGGPATGRSAAATTVPAAAAPPAATRSVSNPEIDRAVDDAAELEARGDVDGALRRLHDAALLANPDRRSELYVRAARALAARGRFEEALAEGYAGIAASPRSGWTYLEVAKILAQAGRREAAIEMAQEAASHDAQVRFAALDFIADVSRGRDPTRPATGSSPPRRLPDLAVAGGVAGTLAVLFGGVWYGFRRRRHETERAERTLTVPTAAAVGAPSAVPATRPLASVPPDDAEARPASPPGRTLGTGEFIGAYRIDRIVATSLHSTLYLADDLRLSRQVAIKQANPMGMQSEAALQRFHKEVQSLIALSTYHDGVIKVYDYLPPGTLVTEWVEGRNLDEMVGELPIDRIVQIGIDLCDILAFAHSMAIVHRDIKPSNVMVSNQTHRVKLLDFGIAKNAGLGISQVTTDSDVPIGTFTYMAPEQFASPNQAHGASDIYSLGLTLYRVITGHLPAAPWLGPRTFSLVPPDAFTPVDELAPAVQRFLETLGGDVLPDLDWVADLDRVVGKAFREHAGDRYRSAAEFKAELERVRSLISASVRL